jgi:hypothetical protein
VENWKPIAGHENYEISDHGNVDSLNYRGRKGWRHRLKPHPGGKGHLQVCLDDRRFYAIHTLVLEHFVGPRPRGLLGLHKDGNLQHNHVRNLYWGTYSQNAYDSVRHGTHPKAGMVECKEGHPLKLRSNGRRYCPICNSRMARESKQRKRER